MDMLRGGWGPGLLGNGQGTVGAGSSYDAATEAIAAAFTTPPTTARKDLIDAAVVALKAAGVWAKLDALYAFAAADSQAAMINWKHPGTYNATEVNAPTFTADQRLHRGQHQISRQRLQSDHRTVAEVCARTALASSAGA